MIRRTARRIAGTLRALRHAPGQRREPFRDPEHWAESRDRRVRRIVRHAAATVPHYRELFASLRIDPRELRSARDLAELPLLEKSAVRADPTRFVSVDPAGQRSLSFVTSGSTGEPLEVRHDHDSLLANIAFGERERSVIQAVCGTRYRELWVNYSRSTVLKMWAYYRDHTLFPAPAGRLTVDVATPLPELLALMDDFRPHVLVAYGSFLETLFRVVAARGLEIHRPEMAIYGADGMTPDGRRRIERDFGVPVFSRYNAIEAFKIGFQCPERRGFHLHPDLCDVRIVDGEGREVPDGAAGEIVISNLVNRATVLLNYRLGDAGTRAVDPCACGRTFPLLAELEGRVEDVLDLADGRLVHPRSVWDVFKTRPKVLRYQLVQLTPARFALDLATLDAASFDELRPGVARDLAALLGDAEVEIRRSADVGLGERGKFRPVRGLPPSPGGGDAC